MVRLGRFFSLVHNEYIKILKKTSTKIMFIIVILAAFGLSLLMLAVSKTAQSERSTYGNSYYEDDYQSEIDWLNETKPNGYEQQVELYQFLIDNEIGYDDWRYEVAMNTSELGRADASKCLIFLKMNDWRGYCKLMLSGAQSAGDKWEYAYRMEKDIGFDEEFDKQNEIIRKVNEAKTALEYAGSGDSEEKTNYENQVILGTYQLDNGIYENTADMTSMEDLYMSIFMSDGISFWNVFMLTPMLVSVAGLVMIVIAGGTVASEFHQGTIKFLLINPVKRWKILMSKYFTVISMGYILIAITFVVCIPAVGIVHGFDGLSTPYLYVENDQVCSMNSFLYAARSYLISSVQLVVMATFAFAISSLIRSSALAIGASVFLLFAGETVTTILAELGLDWARFLIFANTDLLAISQGNSMFPQHSLLFAVGVLAAHMAVFILTAWDGFTKRSV